MANRRPKRKRAGSKALVIFRQILGHLARIFATLFLVGVITGCVVVTAITIYVMNFMETDAHQPGQRLHGGDHHILCQR